MRKEILNANCGRFPSDVKLLRLGIVQMWKIIHERTQEELKWLIATHDKNN